jgi:glycine dehydrogenase
MPGIDALTDNVIPERASRGTSVLGDQPGLSEADALAKISIHCRQESGSSRPISARVITAPTRRSLRSLRNLLENLAWYTAYTLTSRKFPKAVWSRC